jgi:hypothetical protein
LSDNCFEWEIQNNRGQEIEINIFTLFFTLITLKVGPSTLLDLTELHVYHILHDNVNNKTTVIKE